MAKSIILAALVVLGSALISFQGSHDLPLAILVEARQWMRLSEADREVVRASNVLFTVRDREEVQYLLSRNIPASDIVVLIGEQIPEWVTPENWILFDRVVNRKVQIPSISAPLRHHKNLVYELVPWSGSTPVELFGNQFFWVHRVMAWEIEGLSFFREIQRFERAVRERSVTHLYFEFRFDGPIPVIKQWHELSSELDLNRRSKPDSQAQELVFQPLRHLFTMLVLLVMGFKLHFVFFLPLLFFLYEYPISIQLQGFCFCLFSVFWVVAFVVRPYQESVNGFDQALRLNQRVLFWLLSLGSIFYAIMGSLDFEMRIFLPRGVKVLLIFPVLLVFLLEVVELIRVHKRQLFQALGIPWERLLLMALFGGLGFAWLILRSGNQEILPASDFEIGLREVLEEIMIARPRTREIIFWIAPVFLLYGLHSGAQIYRLIGVLAYTLLASSSLNTFSHFHTPYWMVVLRTVNAFLIAQGLILLLFWFKERLYRKSGRDLILGYFGFGNLGDDLLMLAASKTYPQANFLCGTVSKIPIDSARAVYRTQRLSVFLSLVSCPRLIVGPGGVLQDQSSRLSLVYYCSFILFARFCGAKIEYFGLGMSPLKHNSSKLLIRVCNRLVRQAIVRDIDSSLNLQALGLSREKITVAPDLVFSLKLPVKEVKKEGVCLILRSAPGINAQALANTVAATCKTRGITLGLILFEDELALRNYVKSAMPEVPLVVYEGDFEKLLEVMSGCIGVISMRYHGIVLARMLKREVLVLSYDAKCHFLAKEHNLMEVELGELLGDMSFVRDKVGVFLDEVATNRSQHAY